MAERIGLAVILLPCNGGEGGREGGRGVQCTVLIKCIHFQVRVSDDFFSEDPSPLVSPSHMTVMC